MRTRFSSNRRALFPTISFPSRRARLTTIVRPLSARSTIARFPASSPSSQRSSQPIQAESLAGSVRRPGGTTSGSRRARPVSSVRISPARTSRGSQIASCRARLISWRPTLAPISVSVCSMDPASARRACLSASSSRLASSLWSIWALSLRTRIAKSPANSSSRFISTNTCWHPRHQYCFRSPPVTGRPESLDPHSHSATPVRTYRADGGRPGLREA